MVFERGPVAFLDESRKLVRKSLGEDSAMQHLSQTSSSHMFDRMRVLMELRSSLASFLAQVYHQKFHSFFFFNHNERHCEVMCL